MTHLKYFTLIILLFALVGCDSSKLSKTSDEKFIGTWQLEDRGILSGLHVEIIKNDKGALKGSLKKLNDNKYVQMFMEVGDPFVTEIKRTSNYEFIISEKKIAAPLFSAYGQSTTSEFEAEFNDKNELLLGKKGGKGKYIRVE